jgi:hypothetical protein
MKLTDAVTVQKLELRAPMASKEDATFIKAEMDARTLFRSVSDVAMREMITNNILSVRGLIPSLFTFCEDTKYLEPCANAMKKLLEPKFKGTVYSAMRDIFSGTKCKEGLFLRQDGERQFVSVSGYEVDRFNYSYRQLYAYTWRHFPELVNVAPRKEPDQPKPVVKEPDPIRLHQFADLASKLGFTSSKLQEMSSTKALEQAVHTYLLRTAEYSSGGESLEDQVKQIQQALMTSEGQTFNLQHPILTTDVYSQDLQHRCGRPFENAQKDAKKSVYIQWLYDSKETRGRYITSFFVQRSAFLAFFGEKAIQTTIEGLPDHERTTASRTTASSDVRDSVSIRLSGPYQYRREPEVWNTTGRILRDETPDMRASASLTRDLDEQRDDKRQTLNVSLTANVGLSNLILFRNQMWGCLQLLELKMMSESLPKPVDRLRKYFSLKMVSRDGGRRWISTRKPYLALPRDARLKTCGCCIKQAHIAPKFSYRRRTATKRCTPPRKR